MPKKTEKMVYGEECCGMHRAYKGWKMLLVGLLVIGNAMWMVVDWWTFVGVILALAGLWKLIMPMMDCK